MIKEIYLENWKSHEKSIITFDKINLIIGRMGSGKTSITDAISYALFGNFSDLNSKKIKLEDIIMKRPREKDYTKVILNFNFENKEYEILRTIEKNKGSYAEIKENKKVIRSGTSETNEFIKKLLKIDFHTFINVVYAEQNKIDFFLNLERGERKTKFDQLIGIEKLEMIRKTSVSVKNRLLDIHKEKEKILFQLISEKLDENLEKIKREIEESEEKIKNLEKNKFKIINILEDLKKKVEEGKLIKERINLLEKEIIEIKTKINNSKNLLEKLLSEVVIEKEENINTEIIELNKQIKNLKKEEEVVKLNIKELREKKEENVKKILDSESKLKKLDELSKKLDELKTVEYELENLKNIQENSEKRLIFIKEKLKELEVKEKEEERILEILGRDFSICPICEREISVENKTNLQKKHLEIKEHLKKEYENLKKEFNILEREFLENKKKIENLIFKTSEKKALEEEYNKLKNLGIENLERLKLELNEINKNIEDLENKVHLIQNNISEINFRIREKLLTKEKIEKKKNLEKEMKNLEDNLKELIDVLNNLNNNENFRNLNELEKTLKNYEIQSEKINQEIENTKKLLSIFLDRKKEIEERIKVREKLKREKEHLERVIKDLNILEICAKESQLIIRSKLLDAINYFLSYYWKKIYPYRDYIDARFVATEDDYVFQLKDSLGRWTDLDKAASGGERMLAAICLRIAFSKVLSPQLNIIIFDEPTHNLDEEAITQFAKIINENFSEIFDQVFIITHDERFKSLINANIIKVERNKLEDMPSQILSE